MAGVPLNSRHDRHVIYFHTFFLFYFTGFRFHDDVIDG